MCLSFSAFMMFQFYAKSEYFGKGETKYNKLSVNEIVYYFTFRIKNIYVNKDWIKF